MTDLIKRLGTSCYLAFEDGTNDYSAAQEAIDRIEELEKQCSFYARADRLFVEDINELEAKLTKAVEALKSLHHAVCGETGFASAVRNHSGKAYPWEPLDIADAQTRAVLTELGVTA